MLKMQNCDLNYQHFNQKGERVLEKIPTPLLYALGFLALGANIAFDSVFYTLSAMIDGALIAVALMIFLAIQKKKSNQKKSK